MNPEQKEKILSVFEDKKYPEKYQDLSKKAVEFLEKKGSKKVQQIIGIVEYLSQKNLDNDNLIAAILFLEYEEKNKEEINKTFGEEIHSILLEEKRLSEAISKSRKEKSEIAREVILSSVEDIRVILLELASKFSEMRLFQKKEDAKEAMEKYIPLANRLGFEKIKKDMTNISFKILNPKKYEEISNFLKMSEKEREKYVKEIIEELEKNLKKEIKNFKITGREKQIYSIYEKIVKRKIPLNKQKDQFGIRIVTETPEDCYKALINNKYPLIENTFKDYIKKPKENGYKSLHFCIRYGEKIVEIQTRTKEMNEFAEEGAAAHWEYKKINGNEKFEKKTAWLKEIMKLKEKKNSIFEGIKINLFKDKIYCYTPKGKMVSLPAGATALDFAYRIHAEIGNHSVGVLVNKKFLPLKTDLKNGDTIEVITNKFQRPRRDWLKYVNTKYAKRIITREIKKIENIPVPKIPITQKEKTEENETLALLDEFPNHIVNFAKCCNPLPKEEITGVLRSYRRALVHKKDCEILQKSKKSGVKAGWKEILTKPAKLFAQTTDRSGILADLINTISRKGFKIKEANAKITGNNFAECYFVVFAQTIDDIEEIIKRMKKIKGVKKIWV